MNFDFDAAGYIVFIEDFEEAEYFDERFLHFNLYVDDVDDWLAYLCDSDFVSEESDLCEWFSDYDYYWYFEEETPYDCWDLFERGHWTYDRKAIGL
jgi:hypothetical protein